jgi:acetyltransferase-like isoleucine patch superfamily enzyme/glycosyltransferase involved in cell wall biosynthesis
MIDVLIITHNESLNLPHCLSALRGWTRKIFVVDSGSTDGTQDIARSHGAEVMHHDWEGYARQKNWGLRTLPFESEWILIVDADEVITERVKLRLLETAQKPSTAVPENGFFINRLTYFMGRPIRHCGFFPSWNLRFFKRGAGRYEDRAVHEHVIVPDPVGYIREPMLHDDRRGLEHYFAKHNRYSTLEARALFEELRGSRGAGDEANISADTRRRRWLKRNVMPHVPFPGFWRFMYMYILQFGILDGRAGFEFCRFIAMYDSMVALKLRELRRISKEAPSGASAAAPARGLARAEGAESIAPAAISANGPIAEPSPSGRGQSTLPPVQMQPEASPWTFREKLGRAIWMLVGRPIFRLSFHNWYAFRASILRLFGAKIGRGVAVRPTVNIEVPWMIEIEDDATVGDHAILYSLGKISIGKRSIVSQYAHLCAGTHDYTDHTFKLIRSPISIGDDVWVGADAFIGPGVRIDSLSVVGARSSVYKDAGPRQVFVGNPAKPIKERILR